MLAIPVVGTSLAGAFDGRGDCGLARVRIRRLGFQRLLAIFFGSGRVFVAGRALSEPLG